MRTLLILAILFLTGTAKGQSTIEWDAKYQLQLSDFKSPATEIGGGTIYTLNAACGFDFSFHMTNAEFVFTKNFNSKVRCFLDRNAALMVAPDSLTAASLLDFARYEFDLAELYARRFRKKLYEEKGAFSNVNFFAPIYEEAQREFIERYTEAGKITNLGESSVRLKELHQEVLSEIAQLSDFCRLCKPPRKKK